MYNLPTVRDSAAYQNHQRSCEESHPCKCELNSEMLKEEAVLSREVAMTRSGELVPHLSDSMGRFA